MSLHVSRRERWEKRGDGTHRSLDGHLVRPLKGEWWADVAYSLFVAGGEGEVMEWRAHFERLGPFKRPRNAMVEAERHATALRNRRGVRVRFEDAAPGRA